MKKVVLFILLTFCLIGCTKDKITLEKDEYLLFKEELLEQNNFTNDEDITFDLTISLDRINEEELSYRAIIDNPKENMHNIKALITHNHYTEKIFPSIGIFDDTIDLIVNNDKVKGINLVGYIKSAKEINDLDIKVYVEYTNDFNEVKKIYYNSTI